MFGSIFYNKFGLQYAPERLEEKEKFTYLHVQTYSKQTNKTSPLLIHYSAGFPDSQQSPTFSFFFCFINYSFCWNPLERKTDSRDRKQKSERKESLAFFSYLFFCLCIMPWFSTVFQIHLWKYSFWFLTHVEQVLRGFLMSCTSL